MKGNRFVADDRQGESVFALYGLLQFCVSIVLRECYLTHNFNISS